VRLECRQRDHILPKEGLSEWGRDDFEPAWQRTLELRAHARRRA
jgi:hypothetical protein